MLIQRYGSAERQRKQADALAAALLDRYRCQLVPGGTAALAAVKACSYDYLRGIGALDWHLWVNGWLESAFRRAAAERCRAVDRSDGRRCRNWRKWPGGKACAAGPTALGECCRPGARTQMIYPDIALSYVRVAYGNQDSTLVVDLPGFRDLPRCYFIADGREDPYGN